MRKKTKKSLLVFGYILGVMMIVGAVYFTFFSHTQNTALPLNQLNPDLTYYCNNSLLNFISSNNIFNQANVKSNSQTIGANGMKIIPAVDVVVTSIDFYKGLGGYAVIMDASDNSYVSPVTAIQSTSGGISKYVKFTSIVKLYAGKTYYILYNNGAIFPGFTGSYYADYWSVVSSNPYPKTIGDIIWTGTYNNPDNNGWNSEGILSIGYTKVYSGCNFPADATCLKDSTKCYDSFSYLTCEQINISKEQYYLWNNPMNCADNYKCDDSTGSAKCVSPVINAQIICLNNPSCNFGENKPLDGIKVNLNTNQSLSTNTVYMYACPANDQNCIGIGGEKSASLDTNKQVTFDSTKLNLGYPTLLFPTANKGQWILYARIGAYNYTIQKTINILPSSNILPSCDVQTVKVNTPQRCSWIIKDSVTSKTYDATTYDNQQVIVTQPDGTTINPTTQSDSSGNYFIFTPTQVGGYNYSIAASGNGYLGETQSYSFAASNDSNAVTVNITQPVIITTSNNTAVQAQNVSLQYLLIDNKALDNTYGYSLGNHSICIDTGILNGTIKTASGSILTPAGQTDTLSFDSITNCAQYNLQEYGKTYTFSGSITYTDPVIANTIISGKSGIINTSGGIAQDYTNLLWSLGIYGGIGLIVLIIVVIVVLTLRKKKHRI